jgi:1-acyl-sn-glycerol-3-phosphate acyltransferase
MILILQPTNRYKAYLMKSLARFLNKLVLNLKIDIDGLENIPKLGRLVAYANHKSYTDAFALLQYFPRPITLTPKKAVLKIPFLRWWLKAYDVFPINRTNPKETLKDLNKAVKTVENGHVILFFPEGSIKDRENSKIENVKAGSFRLVKNAQADILPILFEGNNLVRHRWPKRTHRKITIFPIIPYTSFKNLKTHEIAQLFMDTINQ